MTRRTVYAILAVVCAVLGVAALAAGTILATTFGRSEQIRSEPTALSGPGAAIIAEQLHVDASNIPLPDDVGELTVEVSPVGPRALFVGTAQATPLDDYLSAVPYDVVTSLAPGGRAEIRSVPGSILPRPPAQETFWLEQRAGTPGQVVRLDADLGDQANLVVTNLSPADGVEADIRVTYTVRGVWNVALGLLIGGAVLVLLTALLWWRSHAAGRRARAAAARGEYATPAPSAATILPVTEAAPAPTPQPVAAEPDGPHPVVPPPVRDAPVAPPPAVVTEPATTELSTTPAADEPPTELLPVVAPPDPSTDGTPADTGRDG